MSFCTNERITAIMQTVKGDHICMRRGEEEKNPICNKINDSNVAKRRMATHLTLGQEQNEVSLPTLMK